MHDLRQRVDKDANAQNKRRKLTRDFGNNVAADPAFAAVIEHEPEGICARFDGSARIGQIGDPADFDSELHVTREAKITRKATNSTGVLSAFFTRQFAVERRQADSQ